MSKDFSIITIKKGKKIIKANPSPEPFKLTYLYDKMDKLMNIINIPRGFDSFPFVIKYFDSDGSKKSTKSYKQLKGRNGMHWDIICYMNTGRGGRDPWFYGKHLTSGSLLLFLNPNLKGEVEILYFQNFYPELRSDWDRLLFKYIPGWTCDPELQFKN